MATILNNSLTADESILRVHNPIIYVPDPTKGKPLSEAKLYFGVVGLDPTQEENQKIVYALQEDGSAVPLNQPALCSAGGVPVHNGGYVSLAVSGSYSLAIHDKNDAQVYYFPRIEGFNLQGFSGVIIEESQTISGSQTLTFSEIEVTTSSFYISKDSLGVEFKGEFLQKGVDYVINSSTSITLISAATNGTIILARQMDPTGQIVPVTEGSSVLFVFNDISGVLVSDLQPGDTLTLNGGIVSQDKLGGNKYVTVLGQPETEDGENYINLDNGNQIQALENNFKLARYSEVTNSAAVVANTININLAEGNVHEALLTENINSVSFINVNPESNLTTTVTLKITQDSSSAFTVSYPSSIKWAGGTAPTMTNTLSGYDRYVFVSSDGGTSWDGGVMGQDFS